MNVLCIQKFDKSRKIKDIFNYVLKKENKIFIYTDLEKSSIQKKIRIIKKIKKILIKEKVDKVIVSKQIKKDKDFINLLHSNNVNMCNERWLFKMLTYNVIDQVLQNKKKEESEIWITVNDADIITQNIIYMFSKEFKRVNIITNHIRKFKEIENKLYEDGIMITITNNRRKSLSKANLILNIDFPKELLNQFTIFDNATIINLEGNVFIKKKRFNGKVINDIKIKSFESEEIDNFISENDLYDYDIKDICEVLNIVPKCDIIFM